MVYNPRDPFGRATTSAASKVATAAAGRAPLVQSQPGRGTTTFVLPAPLAAHAWDVDAYLSWLDAMDPHTEDAIAAMSPADQSAATAWVWQCLGRASQALNLPLATCLTFLTAYRDALRQMVYDTYQSWAGLPPGDYTRADWTNAQGLMAPCYLAAGLGEDHAVVFRRMGPLATWPLGVDPSFAAWLQAPDPITRGQLLWARVSGPVSFLPDGSADLDLWVQEGGSHGVTWDAWRVYPSPPSAWAWGPPGHVNPTNGCGAAPPAGLNVVPSLRQWYRAGLALRDALRAVRPEALLLEAEVYALTQNAWVATMWNLPANVDQAGALAAALAAANTNLLAQQHTKNTAYAAGAGLVGTAAGVIALAVPVGTVVAGAMVLAAAIGGLLVGLFEDTSVPVVYDFWSAPQPDLAQPAFADPAHFVAPPPPPGGYVLHPGYQSAHEADSRDSSASLSTKSKVFLALGAVAALGVGIAVVRRL